jgi:hypothetical protein
MPDPTGTSGPLANEEKPDFVRAVWDLSRAMGGGPNFMERLQELADATDRNAQAFAQLRVGENAKAALAEAANQREAAAAELAKARQDAAALRTDVERERAVASDLLRSAEELIRGAQEKERQAIQVGDAARQAAARADERERIAAAKEGEFNDKIAVLKAALREM